MNSILAGDSKILLEKQRDHGFVDIGKNLVFYFILMVNH